MSVVKKYQPGGTIDYSQLERDVSDYIRSSKFKSKIQPEAELLAPKIIEAFKLGAIKVDPNTNSYILDTNIYKGDPLELQGTQNVKDKKNIFGQVTEKTGKGGINEAIISYIYQKYPSLAASPTQKVEEPKNSGITRNLLGLNEYIVKNEFNSNPEAYNEYLKALPLEDAKKYIQGMAQKHLTEYEEQKKLNLLKPQKEQDIYGETPFLNDLRTSTGLDFEKFQENALKAGWTNLLDLSWWETPKPAETTQTTETNVPSKIEDSKEGSITQNPTIQPQKIELDLSWLNNVERREVPDKSKFLNEIINLSVGGYQLDKSDIEILAYLADNKSELTEEEQEKLSILLENIKNSNPIENGLLKLRQGGTIGASQLSKKLENIKVRVAKDTTVKNLFRGPVTTDKTLSVISTVGDIASVLPVVGAAGAATSTVADFIKDVKDGKIDDIGTHMANLAFTGLSFVGFGGVKTALKAAKLAKAAGEAGKLSKLAQLESKVLSSPLLTSKASKWITVPLAVNPALGAAQSITSDAKNISLGNISGIAQAGVLGKNYFKDIKVKKALATQTNPLPEKTVINVLDKDKNVIAKEISISGELPKPVAEGKKWYNPFGRGAAKEANESKTLLEKYNQTAKEPVKEGSIEIVKKVPKGIELKDKVSGTGKKAEKQYALAKKTLDKHGLTKKVEPEQPKVEPIKESKVEPAKPVVETKKVEEPEVVIPKTEAAEKTETFTAKVKKIKKSTDKTKQYKKNMAKVPKNKLDTKPPKKFKKYYAEGGILKAKGGVKYPYLSDPYTDQLSPFLLISPQKSKASSAQVRLNTNSNYRPGFGPIFEVPKFDTKVSKSQAQVQAQAPVQVTGGQEKKPLTVPEIIIPETEFILPGIEHLEIKDSKNKPVVSGDVWNKKKFSLSLSPLQRNLLLNAGVYAKTMKGINEMGRLVRRGITEEIVREDLMSEQYIRASSINAPFYADQANKMRGVGKRLSGVADLDKGMAARLQAEDKAQEIEGKGNQADLAYLQNILNRKQELTQRTQAHNLGAIARNRASVAGAASNIFKSLANDVALKTQSFTNLAQGVNRELDKHESTKKLEKFYNLINSPERKALGLKAAALEEEEARSRKTFEQLLQSGRNTSVSGDWENSPQAAIILAKKKALQNEMEASNEKISSAQWAMQYGLPLKFKSGGSLEEKVYLERLKHSNKKELQEEREYYKKILKNNELLMKSLFKIFK